MWPWEMTPPETDGDRQGRSLPWAVSGGSRRGDSGGVAVGTDFPAQLAISATPGRGTTTLDSSAL